MEKKEVFFSIIVPTYNVEKYLKRCIDSILSQEFTDYELILVDDGSKDNSGVICDEYAKQYSNISVIHKKNAGLGMARNSGIKQAKGKYIWFIDSDDFVNKSSLKILFNEINKYNFPDIVSFGMKSVNQNNEYYNEKKPKKLYINNDIIIKEKIFPDFLYNETNKNYHKSSCAKVYKLDFIRLNNLMFHSEREWISEDYYFCMDSFKNINSILILDKTLYYYYENISSLSRSYKEDRFDKLLKFYKKMDNLVDEYKYINECKIRLRGTFISNLLACIKFEVKNSKKIGIKDGYIRFKRILKNDFVIESFNICNTKKYSWIVLRNLINLRLYSIAFLIFMLKK